MFTFIQNHPVYSILILVFILVWVWVIYSLETAPYLALDWDDDGLYQNPDLEAEKRFSEESGTFLPFFIPSDESFDNWKDSWTQKSQEVLEKQRKYLERDKPVTGLPEFLAMTDKCSNLWQTLCSFQVLYREKLSPEENKIITDCLESSHPFKN